MTVMATERSHLDSGSPTQHDENARGSAGFPPIMDLRGRHGSHDTDDEDSLGEPLVGIEQDIGRLYVTDEEREKLRIWGETASKPLVAKPAQDASAEPMPEVERAPEVVVDPVSCI